MLTSLFLFLLLLLLGRVLGCKDPFFGRDHCFHVLHRLLDVGEADDLQLPDRVLREAREFEDPSANDAFGKGKSIISCLIL